MNTLVIDDNEMARAILAELAKRVKDLVVVGECADVNEARHHLRESDIDVVLLQVDMTAVAEPERLNGANCKRPVILFTSVKRDTAVQAFELNIAGDFLKAGILHRPKQAVSGENGAGCRKNAGIELKEDECIFIRDSNVIRRLRLSEILYVEAMGDYVKLHTSQKFFAVHTSIRAVEARLPHWKFLRVHRSFIVAIDKIDTIKDGVLIVADRPVPVSDGYRAGLNRRMNVL